MGRKLQFDKQLVLNQLMHIFWQQGFDATTYTMLEQQTGLTGRSLIHSFGDKDHMFHQCVENYYQQTKQLLEKLFASASLDSIQQFFDFIVSRPPQDPRNRGCLMVNLVNSKASLPAAVEEVTVRFFSLFRQHFSAAITAENLQNGQHKTELLMAILFGVSTQIRQSQSVTGAVATHHEITNLLQLWRTQKSSHPSQ